MPIEPTSVSKTAVREVEQVSSNFGSWASMQGSSTGGKDRPTSNSIWEKAITGAQKLFGSRAPEPRPENESQDGDDAANAQTGTAPLENGFDAVPGFGSRGFGRFSAAAFGGNTFGTVVTSRVRSEPRFEDSAKIDLASDAAKSGPSALDRGAEQLQSERSEAAGQGERPVVKQEEADDESANEERPRAAAVSSKPSPAAAAQPAAPLPVQASTTADAQPNSPAPAQPTASLQAAVQQSPVADAVTVAKAAAAAEAAPAEGLAKPVAAPQPSNGANQAQKSSQNLTFAESVAEKANPSQVGKAMGKAFSDAAKPGMGPAAAQPVGQEVAQEGSTLKGSLVAQEAPKPLNPHPQQNVPTEAKLPVGLEVPADKIKGSDTLAFDLNKAKETISDTLNRVAGQPVAKPQGQGSSNAPAAPQPVAPSPLAADQGSLASRPQTGEVALSSQLGESAQAKEAAQLDASKREASQFAHQRSSVGRAASELAAQARAMSSQADGLAGEVRAAQAAGQANAANASREAAGAAANRFQAPATSGKPSQGGSNAMLANGLNGVTGGPGTAATSLNSQGAQQGNAQNSGGGDAAAKQDFNAAMKQATQAKGSEKAGNDATQAFDAKVEAAASRRSEAASKASQTSYVSKTVAEVKETIATLTKSIDRLVTDKSSAMNLKINFEGGGSVKLRISMDGNSVKTQMQTDVVGLEGAIKANWAELANDWNQKGVKLSAPQFQNSEAGKESNFDNLNEFASKGDRQAADRQGEGRGQASARGNGQRSFDSRSGLGTNGQNRETAREEVITDTSLKTYA